MNHLASWTFLATAISAPCCVSETDPSSSATSAVVSSGLKMDVEGGSDLNGRFRAEAGEMRFSAHTEWGDTVRATMSMAESRIDIVYDARAGEVGTMSLAIAGALGLRERSVLAEFGTALDRVFPYERDAEQPSGALLRVYAALLSNWTQGATAEPIITAIPRRPSVALPPRTPNDGSAGPGGPSDPAPGPKAPMIPPHSPPRTCGQVGDNDGVAYLASCCNGGAAVSWQHDAIDHCFVTNTNMCGESAVRSWDPLATLCPGRCGSNCNSLPFYTQDCLDHDLCLMHHTGLGSVDPTGSCGDEIFDALDDFGYVYASGIGWLVSYVLGCYF